MLFNFYSKTQRVIKVLYKSIKFSGCLKFLLDISIFFSTNVLIIKIIGVADLDIIQKEMLILVFLNNPYNINRASVQNMNSFTLAIATFQTHPNKNVKIVFEVPQSALFINIRISK